MRRAARENAQLLALEAWQETGLGRYEDKIQKNLLNADKVPGPEILVPTAWTGDDGLTLVEHAPFGVIGAMIPITNPTSTVIGNAHRHGGGGQRGRLQRPSRREGVHEPHRAGPQRRDRRGRRPAQPGLRAGGADDRDGPGADAAPAGEPAHGDGRIGRRPGRDAERKAGDLRRPGQPAGGGRRDGRPGPGRARDRPRGLLRQQHRLHRREGDLRGGQSSPTSSSGRSSPTAATRSTPPRSRG